MRVVGVIDLKGGTAVHAVRGERERYRPVSSVIGGDDGDALALARGFRAELGLDELYVADLDAIVGDGENSASIGALAREARVMVDAGVSEPARAQALLDLGAHRVIVGTETLTGADALDRLLAELPDGALVLSVDLRDGRVLSPDAQLAGLQRAGRRRAPAPRRPARGDRARPGARGQRRGPGRRADRRAPRRLRETSSCWPAAACAASTTCGRSTPPAPPARSSRPRCTAASSARASWRELR